MNTIIERLIDAGHSEAATIAEWKDGLNDMWADLLELIDTRMQLLAASYDLHRYFYTGTEILGLIDEKHRELPEDVGLDASTAESFHRVHTAFERELHLLGVQVPSTHFLSVGVGGTSRVGIRVLSQPTAQDSTAALRHLLASEVVLRATASWLVYSLSTNTQCFSSTGYYFKG